MEKQYGIQIRATRKRAQWGWAWKSAFGTWYMGNRNTRPQTPKFDTYQAAEAAIPEVISQYSSAAWEIRISEVR